MDFVIKAAAVFTLYIILILALARWLRNRGMAAAKEDDQLIEPLFISEVPRWGATRMIFLLPEDSCGEEVVRWYNAVQSVGCALTLSSVSRTNTGLLAEYRIIPALPQEKVKELMEIS